MTPAKSLDYAASPLNADPTQQHGDPAQHRAERNRRLKSTLVVGVFTKPLSLLSRLIITPLFLRYLGRDGYGHYEEIVSMAMMLSLTNLGLTLGLINRLLDCHVSGDRAAARRYMSSLFFSAAAVIGFCLIAWSAATFAVPWVRVFKVTDPRWVPQIRCTVWIAGASVLMGLLFGLPTAVYQGYQENAKAFGWDAAAKVAVFLAGIFVVYTTWGLLGVALATCGVQLLVTLVNTACVFAQRPWLTPRLADFDLSLVGQTLGEGVYLFALQGAVILIFQCDKLVIGSLLSPGDVAVYSLVGGLFIIAYGLYTMVLGPLWSFHGEAIRRGDWAWARKGLLYSLLGGVSTISLCMVLLLIWGDWVFSVWTHGQYTHVSKNLILAVGVMFLARIWVDCRSVVLNAAGVLRPQVMFFIAHALLNLVGAVLVARRFGVVGVAWITPATALLTSVWGYPILISRLARRMREGGVMRATAAPPLPIEEPL